MVMKWLLGSWRFPSGNGTDVYVEQDAGGKGYRVTCEWDHFPPSKRDVAWYKLRVMPELTKRLMERTGTDGNVLYVDL